MKADLDLDDALICSPNDIGAALRSKIYALLAEAFSYPQGDVFVRVCNGELISELRVALEDSPLSLEHGITYNALFDQSSDEELRSEYSSLFDVAGGVPRVSLLERSYCQDPEQKLWEKLLRFYSHFGLDFSQGAAQEQPDHLVTELSFMHYLCFLQARKSPDYESIGRGQADFLSLHLSGFAEGVAKRLSQVDQSSIYAGLGLFLNAVVAADLEHTKAKFRALSSKIS